VEGNLRAQVIKVGMATARCHPLHVATLLDKAGYPLPERLWAGLLLTSELGPLDVGCVQSVAIKQRVADAEWPAPLNRFQA